MRQIYTILILVILLSSCQVDNNRTNSKTEEDKIQNDDSIHSKLFDTVKILKTEIPKKDMEVLNDSIQCEIDDLFSEIELPLVIDYKFFSDFDRSIDKNAIPYKCIGDGKVEEYQGLPISIYYAYGKITLKDSIELYLMITGMNPENSMDLFYISASVMKKKGDKLDNETMIAKYHAYSMIQEEYYCTIDKHGLVNQTYTHTGEYEGKKDVFEKGDTILNLIEINNNLR